MKTFKVIVKLLFIVWLGVTLIGCSPKIIKEIITKDSIVYKEKLVYKDTTIFKYLPGDTVFKDVIVYVDKSTGLANSKKIFAFTSLAEASAWVYNSRLFLNLIQKDTTIEIRLDSAIREASYWMEKYKSSSTVTTKETFKTPWYMKALALLGGLSLVIIGLWIYKNKF